MSTPQNNIPNEYICPITLDIMREPMVMPDGHTYEKEAIKKALELRPFSPLTKKSMKFSDGYINYSLKSLIETYISEHNICLSDSNIDEKLHKLLLKQEEITKIEFEELSACYLSEENNANIYNDAIHISMKPKKNIKNLPVFLICVVDTSGSMDANCCNNICGMESMYLSRLDLIKHSLKTIISILRKEDMISIIKFDSNANVIVEPTVLSGKDEQKRVISDIDKMEPTGLTNIWSGIKMGIDISNSIPFKNYIKSIIVFTDGSSNCDPPLGVLPTLKEKLKISNNDFTISTFSYGSEVNSKLLIDIANIGNGIYGYCYDGSMVGTTFINYMSNLLSTITPVVKVKVFQSDSIKKTMSIGPLYRGGYRNSIFKIDKNLLDQTSVIVEIPMTQQQLKVPITLESPNLQSYIDKMSKLEKKQDLPHSFLKEGDNDDDDDELLDNDSDSDSDDMDIQYEDIDVLALCKIKDSEPIILEENILNQLIRNKLIITLNKITKIDDISRYDQSNLILNEFLELLKGLKYKTKFIKNIIIDIESPDPNHGQVEKAIRNEYYDKWGKCYINSFLRFHQFEQCGNFKDQSLQYYANDIFTFYRKWAHSIFINLPPPEHQNNSHNLNQILRFSNVSSGNNNNSNRFYSFSNVSSGNNNDSNRFYSFSNVSSGNNNNSNRFYSFSNVSSGNNNDSNRFYSFSNVSSGNNNNSNRFYSFSNVSSGNTNNTNQVFGFGGNNSNNTTNKVFGFSGSNNNDTSNKAFGFSGSNNNNNTNKVFGFSGSNNNNNTNQVFGFSGNNNNNNTNQVFGFDGSNNNNTTNQVFGFGGSNNNNSTNQFFRFGESNNNSTTNLAFGFGDTFNKRSSTSSKVNMASFLNRHGGCFDGNAIVLMANGQKKCVKDLKKGDCLKNNSIVQCLIEQNISNKTNDTLSKPYMCDIHGVLFTPYHPILMNNNWYFPIELVNSIQVTIKSWYNLILDDGVNKKYEVEFSNGIKAITLGHYRNDNEILKHPYFGTDLVLKDLKERDPAGYSKGYIHINDFNTKQLQYDNNHYCINYYKAFSESEKFN